MAKDLTTGRPIKVLLAFSLPMLVGNMVQQLYNMVDLAIVGRFVGVDALAAVGATGSTMFFIFSLVAGLTNGASVVVSQYYGYGDEEKTRRTISTGIFVLGVAAALLTVFGTMIVRPVLTLMNTPAEILDGAVIYLRVIALGIAATVAYNTAANIIRALGDSVTPLIFLVVAVILNVFLDLLFIVPMEMGIAGAALATVIAQAFSAVACVIYSTRKMPILRLGKSDWVVDRTILVQTIKLGVPGGVTNSVMSVGGMIVQTVINSFGSSVVAAYSVAHKIDQMAVQPLNSLAMGLATFSAQNMGAGKIDRVRKGFWSANLIGAVFSAVIGPLLFLFGGQLMKLFIDSGETEIIAIGVSYLRVVSGLLLIISVLLLLEGFLRGVGDVFVPLFSNVVEHIVRIIASLSLAAAFGYLGVWFSGPIAWSVGVLVCGVRYASGKWQYKALVTGEPPKDMERPHEEKEREGKKL